MQEMPRDVNSDTELPVTMAGLHTMFCFWHVVEHESPMAPMTYRLPGMLYVSAQ